MGFAIIETAIGLILVFLVVSLVCSALREMVESLLKQRALDLERGIRELLNDSDGKGLATALYGHPLVFGLFSGKYEPQELKGKLSVWFGRGRNLPSYIPTSTFAQALVDLYKQGKINGIYHPEINNLMRVLSEGAGDTAQLRKNVEEWFDGAAERMSGWYKRRTYAVLLALGIATALLFNVNAIVIAHELYNRSDLRAAVNASAEKVVAAGLDQNDCQRPETNAAETKAAEAKAAEAKAADTKGAETKATDTKATGTTTSDIRTTDKNTPETTASQHDAQCALNASVKELNDLASAGLPIGWKSRARLKAFVDQEPRGIGWPIVVLGWIATGLSVTFGAPFWFDMLSKFVAVRSTIKGLKSEPAAVPAPAAPPAAPPAAAKAEAALVPVSVGTNGNGAKPQTVTVPFEPHQWRDVVEGDEEGDL